MVSCKGKLNGNPSRLAEDHRTVNNVGIRDVKVYSEGKKIKVFGRESSGADGIDVAKNPLMPTRGVPKVQIRVRAKAIVMSK